MLLLVLVLYVGAWCSLAAGLHAQRRRAAHRCPPAAEVEDKINRLPLRYFDRQPRGDLLSRVTNDIDNVAQSCSRR